MVLEDINKFHKKTFDNSLKLIAKSSLIIFIGIFLSKIFTYAYRIIIARQLGPEAYGLFSLAIMLAGLFIAIAGIGLSEGILRFISIYRGKEQKEKISELTRLVLIVTTFTGIIGGILLFFSAEFISINIFNEPDLINFLKFFSIIIPLSVTFSIFMSILKSHEEIGWFSLIQNILLSFLHIILIIFFLYLGLKLNAIIFSYIFGLIISLFLAGIIINKKISYIFKKRKLGKKKKLKRFHNLFSYSIPLLFVASMWKIFHWTDSFIIGFFYETTMVGFYNAAIPIAFLLTIAPLLFMQLFFPLVSKEYSMGKTENVKQLSKQVGKWILIINLPLLSLLILFPGYFLELLFGEEFLIASEALRILSIGVIFLNFGEISIRLIEMKGKSRIIFYDLIIVSAINLILNIILVEKYGINGAALATSLSFIILTILVNFQVYKYLKIFPLRRKIVNVFIAVIISSIPLYLAKEIIHINLISLSILIIFYILIYIFLIIILKGLDKNDLMIIKSIVKKLQKRSKIKKI
jgi:O-antigen/teichoic acid export membrane protein